jgi:hypothetical protein
MKIYMKGRILVEFDLWSCMSCFWLYTCTLVSGCRIWLLVNIVDTDVRHVIEKF